MRTTVSVLLDISELLYLTVRPIRTTVYVLLDISEYSSSDMSYSRDTVVLICLTVQIK
jgi:hypothetical protein